MACGERSVSRQDLPPNARLRGLPKPPNRHGPGRPSKKRSGSTLTTATGSSTANSSSRSPSRPEGQSQRESGTEGERLAFGAGFPLALTFRPRFRLRGKKIRIWVGRDVNWERPDGGGEVASPMELGQALETIGSALASAGLDVTFDGPGAGVMEGGVGSELPKVT